MKRIQEKLLVIFSLACGLLWGEAIANVSMLSCVLALIATTICMYIIFYDVFPKKEKTK